MRESSTFIVPAPPGDSLAKLASVPASVQELAERSHHATQLSAHSLSGKQDPRGFWHGELTADTTLESDYVQLLLWLYPPDKDGWDPAIQKKIQKATRTILDRQLPDGGWNIYIEGPSEVNATTRAYVALRIGGYDPGHSVMQRARERILDLGGLQATNSYTKNNLSLFGLYPRKYTPTVPPELVLIPGKRPV